MITRQRTTTEARRLAHQVRLDAIKSTQERNKLGQFATPPLLANEIARYALHCFRAATPEERIRFLEPAVGSGAFFSALREIVPADQLETATGIETDPAFARVARDLWAADGLRVVERDFFDTILRHDGEPDPNFILANPPYIRHHHFNASYKSYLQRLALEHIGLQVNGLAGLYVYFLLLASAQLSRDGIAAWLIPSEFMDVNYGTVLKRYLSENVTLLRIHRYDPTQVQFDDALVTSAVVVLRNTPPSATAAAEFTYGGSLMEPHRSESVTLDRLKATRKWTLFPAAPLTTHTLKLTGTPVLGDLFKIQRGIATGANGFFVLPRAEALTRDLPHECLRPILPSPRALRETIIRQRDDGYPDIEEQFVLIDCDLPEAAVRERYPALWRYLQTADAQGVRSRYLVRKRTPWYKQERRASPPFLSTYMGRSIDGRSPFRFLWNQSKAIATNLYLLLYPKEALAMAIAQTPSVEGDIYEILSAITGAQMREENRVYGGGLNKIEPSELARISAAPFLERIAGLGHARERFQQPHLPF